MGAKSRFSISVPQKGIYYRFYSNDSLWFPYSYTRDFYKECVMNLAEMENIFNYFSDTTIFQWKEWGNNGAYPAGDCMIGIIEPDVKESMNYVCSINNDSSTLKILRELAIVVSGDAQVGFNKAIDTIEAGAVKGEKYFDTIKLKSVDIFNIKDGIWGSEDTLVMKTDFFYSNIKFPGYIKGIAFTGYGKNIEIAVYQSQEVAINAMEQKSHFENVSSSHNDPFWFNSHKEIYIIKWNAIIIVSMQNIDFNYFSNNLTNTAIELVNRVEDLCEYTE